jgi:Flp pilus assembly protein TadG
MLSLHSVGRPAYHRFFRDRQGNIVPFLALAMFFVLVPAVGIAIDYTRAVQFKTALQGIADAAAIAGATVYVDGNSGTLAQTTAQKYMDLATPKLPKNNGVSACPQVTSPLVGPSTDSNGNATSYNVTITVCASLKTTFLSIFTPTLPIRVTATAQDKIVTATATLKNFNSSADDLNEIYWYVIPSGASSTWTPDTSTNSTAIKKIFSNKTSKKDDSSSKTIPAGQQIGFAMKNTTDGIGDYCTSSKNNPCKSTANNNNYGGISGSVHWFFSHLNPPSSQAYKSVTQNCNIELTNPNAAAPKGSCSDTTPTNAAPSCAQLNSLTLQFNWNDMGGPSDDKDYDDIVYTITCSAGGTGSSGVVLTN